MTTLKDIAQQLGLSESTVSRTLNGKGRASDATRRRIREYAESVGYRPNLRARNLRLRSTRTIGVLVPDISNLWYAHLFKAVAASARREGYRAMLFDADEDPAREDELIANLPMGEVDSLIVATSGGQGYGELSEGELARVVFVDNSPELSGAEAYEGGVNFIGSDNVASGERLTRHLLDLGYGHIATLVGPQQESTARDRLEGFRQAHERAGRRLEPGDVVETSFLYGEGLAAARELLAGARRPDAVIAQNNMLAYATLRAARERGLEVPGDLAIACVDHIDPYGASTPNFTCMRQPLDDIARIAAATAIGAARGETTRPARTVLAAQFVPGDTT